MATSKRKDKGDADYLRATWDLLGDVCLAGSVQVGMRVDPTPRRGIFTVTATAYQTVPNSKPRVVARYVMEYPTSQVLELSAALFRAANQLDRLVAEDLGGTLDTAYAPA